MGKDTRTTRVVLEPTLGDSPTTWYEYQRYYAMGLRMLPDVQFECAALVDRTLAAARDHGLRGTHSAWERTARRNAGQRSARETHVGRYTVHVPGKARPLRVAIDAHDGRDIRDPDALDWAQLYFKVSYWPTLDYGPKVQPLICGNGALDHGRIARLRDMRDTPRSLDLAFIAKLWPSNPSAPTYWNPVEHLVATFETLARLPIRSQLCAIIPPLSDGAPFPQRYLRRLADAGVPIVHGDTTAEELWRASSAARIAFLRPGKHLCVSWRMIDHLALGAATLCDKAAYPRWPVPLRAGHEFQDCDVGIGYDESLPDKADYARIGDTVMDLLADEDRLIATRRAAARYFDQHVAPERLARHFIETTHKVADAHTEKLAKPAATPPLIGRPADERRRAPAMVPAVDVNDTGVHPVQTSLLEFTQDAVIIWEMNGRGITYWNPAAEVLYGFRREEARGQSTHSLLHTHVRGSGVRSMEADLARYGVWVGELAHTTKSGDVVHVEARLSVLSQADGRWLVLEVNRDVTDRKAAGRQSREMQEQLSRLRRLQETEALGED